MVNFLTENLKQNNKPFKQNSRNGTETQKPCKRRIQHGIDDGYYFPVIDFLYDYEFRHFTKRN
jgi:hypothetical protein